MRVLLPRVGDDSYNDEHEQRAFEARNLFWLKPVSAAAKIGRGYHDDRDLEARMSALVLKRAEAAGLCRVCLSTFDSWVLKGVVPGPMSGTRRWSAVALQRALSGDVMAPVAANDNMSPFEDWKRANAR